MGGFITMMQRMIGGEDGGGGGKDVSIVPTDLKVLVGEDTEGVAAKLVARDTDLDLAWVQIKEPGGKKYDFIDIGQNEVPKIGQNLLTVERLAKHFDRVPAFGEVKLAAITKKPRDLFIPSMMSTTYGVPVFTEGGKFVGVFVLQVPEGGDQNNPMAMFEMRDAMGGLILPADEVVKATKRALEGGDSGAKDEAKKNEGKEKKKE
ncbi:trypsin-like peptidase domain-containing protein [Candidatus Sumerlaeota bacterium]|nr:trypsin-like peptidase domain-containing protein [Candidatus Sumerlaeota bacterium]